MSSALGAASRRSRRKLEELDALAQPALHHLRAERTISPTIEAIFGARK